jgi:hypothetical protein
MAFTKYVVEKENHTGDVVVEEVSSDKLFEMSGSPHVKRLNVLEKWEGKKMVEQNYNPTTHEITKKGVKPIKVVEEKA